MANLSNINNKFLVTTGGNVGIGTTSPSYPLQVERSSFGVVSRIGTIDGTNNPRLILYGSAAGSHIQHTWSSAAGNLIFEVGGSEGSGTERMRIDSSGNVGIGTTSPDAKLDILGASSDQLRLRTAESEEYKIGRNSSTGLLEFYGTQSGYTGYVFGGVNGERMRIDSSGNVGIGVTPEAWTVFNPVLRVGDGGALTGTSASNFRMFANTYYDGSYKRIATGTATQYEQDGYHAWYTAASGTANSTISWSERMRIDSSGNVGIGTTSPGHALDVSGNIRLQGGDRKIIFNNGSVETSLDQMPGGVGGMGTLGRFGVGTVSPNNTFQLLGNMTIGSGATNETPRYIQTGGTLIFQATDANHRIIIRGTQNTTGTVTGNSNNMDFYEFGGYNFYSGVNTGTGARNLALSIASDGNVGIGGTPANKLHIQQAKSGTSAENYDLLRFNLTGTGAIGDSSSIVWYSTSGTKTAGIDGISGQDNILYGELAFNVRKYTTDSFDEAMRINNRGNVGIGTTSPDELLQLHNTSQNSYLYMSGGGSLGETYGGFVRGYGVSGQGGHLELGVVDAGTKRIGITIQEQGNQIEFNTAGTERMRIDSSGTVALQNDITWGNGAGRIVSNQLQSGYSTAADNLDFWINYTGYQGGSSYFRDTRIGNGKTGLIAKFEGSSGNVGIGTTSPSHRLYVTESGSQYSIAADYTGTNGSYGAIACQLQNTSPSFIDFYLSSSLVGAIVTTGSNVLYQSYSDYRLKENAVEMTGALDRVNNLKPKRFNFISQPDTEVDGFFAHELQEIVPQAVTGEKDEVNDDGTAKYQGVDNSQIVPLLVGAIKELEARVKELENK